MAAKSTRKILTYLIALVWFVNGLFCKVLGFVPRHEQIVSRILGADYAVGLTKTIGIFEIALAVWVLSGIQSRMSARVQILLVVVMNVIEFVLAPDLLLWGKANAAFALAFVLLVYINEFMLNKKEIRPI